MGILGLSKLIADIAPFAVKDGELKNYFGMNVIFISDFPCLTYLFYLLFNLITGRKIAIDASMCLYQFLIAVRIEG